MESMRYYTELEGITVVVDPPMDTTMYAHYLGLRFACTSPTVQLVHAMSKFAGGEIRSYTLDGTKLYLRRSSPKEHPLVDRAVEKALGATIQPNLEDI